MEMSPLKDFVLKKIVTISETIGLVKCCRHDLAKHCDYGKLVRTVIQIVPSKFLFSLATFYVFCHVFDQCVNI